MNQIKAILFDLGGVLVELAGIPLTMEWAQKTIARDDFWRMWLNSKGVRNFESGRSTPVEFADHIIAEFELKIGQEEFLNRFAQWPKNIYAGARDLLKELGPRYKLGILSNTNELHWNRIINEMDLLRFFDFTFASHHTGLLKPDKKTYRFVIKSLKYLPEEILFFDDNQLNVDGARNAGIRAHKVVGIGELANKIEDLGT